MTNYQIVMIYGWFTLLFFTVVYCKLLGYFTVLFLKEKSPRFSNFD